jgi:hypothetical protein
MQCSGSNIAIFLAIVVPMSGILAFELTAKKTWRGNFEIIRRDKKPFYYWYCVGIGAFMIACPVGAMTDVCVTGR